MKKTVYILILFVVLLLVFEWVFTYFKEIHEVTYKVYVSEKAFDVTEIYQKDNGNTYSIMIKSDNSSFHYVIDNSFNKQKKIVESIEYFNNDNSECIYPILRNNTGTYLQCYKDGKLYTSTSYSNQNYISEIRNILREKGLNLSRNNDTENTEKFNDSTVYVNNLLKDDMIVLWNYKGINTIAKDNFDTTTVLSFDKYENTHGYLVDNYYIIPNYLSSKVLEFSSVTITNLNNDKSETVKLNYTLSSGTYINGVVDGKLYYTDPSNLLQIEINPSNNKVRLIGSKELGGQSYNGKWQDANIYDFVSKKILFKENINLEKYSYEQIIESKSSYYFYKGGEVYQVTKNYLDNPILLFKTSGINNFNVVDDTIYFVSGNTLYYYNNGEGLIPILKNNDLQYNKNNRISIYRKS